MNAPFPLTKAFTLVESGPVVLVTTFDGKRPNIMTLSWTMVTDFTPRFALATGARNHSYAALKKTKECLANIECKVVDIITKHNIVMLEGIAVHVDRHRTETRTLHAVGDGTFIVDGARINKRAQMLSKLPPGV